MSLQTSYTPTFPLNQFVDLIWVGKVASLELQSSHHAPLFTELIFNYGDEFSVEGQHIENNINKAAHQIISGLKTSPFQTSVSGNYSSVGLILKPFCYGLLLKEFGDRSMDAVSNILFDFLIKQQTPDFAAVETHLLKLFEGYQPDKDVIKFERHVSAELLQKGALKDFNMSLAISQKSFIKKFKKHYMLTPGQFVKLKQVNYAIQLIKNSSEDNLTQIGLDAGFYDQSHFIKIFKKFCGVTPGQFLRNDDILNP